MPQSYVTTTYQIVFATKGRRPTLSKGYREALFGYLKVVGDNTGCAVFQVGGVADHVHIVLHLHPSCSMAEVVKKIKLAAHHFIERERRHFPHFDGWQRGYAAITYRRKDRPRLIRYVERQEIHHLKDEMKASDELRMILEKHQVLIDERYFE